MPTVPTLPILLLLAFVFGVFMGNAKGVDSGWKQYYLGKVKCVEVFDKVECRLKEGE